MIAEAAGHTAAANAFLVKLQQAIIFPLMVLLVSIAILMFLWGAYEFVANADNEQARATGRTHMVYGLIGLTIMLSAYAIIVIATNTFGIPIPG